MSDKLHLPEAHGQLIAPRAAIEQRERVQRTLVPCIFQRADWPQILAGSTKRRSDELIAKGYFEKASQAAAHVDAVRQFFSPGPLNEVRSHHRMMHVMAKTADRTLCLCSTPEGYDILRPLSQQENADLLNADKSAPSWHRLTWCGACTAFAGWLTSRPAA